MPRPDALPDAYAEHLPPPALRPFVSCFWTRGAAVADAPHRVLPDGCVDVLLTCDDDGPAAHAVGTMTRAIVVPPAPGTRFVGARLRPGAARLLLGHSAATLTDAQVPLDALWPDGDALRDAAADGMADALRRLADALAARAAGQQEPPPVVRGAVALLERGAVTRIDALAPALGVTRQHLARTFAEHVGVPPKTFARVVRMRRALGALARARRAGWSPVAHALGYADQAHLTREVRALTGLTPGEWLRAR